MLIASPRRKSTERWSMSGPRGELCEGSRVLTRQFSSLETVVVMLEEITDHPGKLIPRQKQKLFGLRRKVKTEFVKE